MLINRSEYNCLLRHDLVSFIERSFYELNPQTKFLLAPHIEVIAAKLEQCRQGKIKRLIINLPPRSLKTISVSVGFVAWLLGHNPSEQIICVSYGQELADKQARDCRSIVTSAWYQGLFPTRMAARTAVSDFATIQQGFRLSTSVGGMLTGRGANFILIDDPIKPDEALSKTARTAVNDWYQNTLLSRLNDKANGCIIIIMQRLHQDDLVGHVLAQDKWDVLSFPAITEVDESHEILSPLGKRQFHRRAGDVLHPEREPRELLAEIRQRMGEYNFQSQYQQNPTPPGGAMIKLDWLPYYDSNDVPRFDRIVQSWDTANKSGELNDFSVCTTWGVRGRTYYLLHVYRKKVTYPDLRRAVIELSKEHSARTVLIEDKGSGTQLIQELERSLCSAVIGYKPPTGTDKIMRLHAQTDLFENNRIFLPKQAPWLQDYINELTGFPGSRYDDQVDSTAQALDYMRGEPDNAAWIRAMLS